MRKCIVTCKVCCNLTHLIDRPHMQTCPRWIEGGGVSIYGNAPPPSIHLPLVSCVNTMVSAIFAWSIFQHCLIICGHACGLYAD